MQNSSKKPKSDILKLGIILCLIAGITSGLVGLVNAVTEPAIERMNEQKTTEALKAVMPDADKFEQVEEAFEDYVSSDGKSVPIEGAWAALKGSDVVGWAVKVAPKGYGGAIEMTVGVSADGAVTGTEIVEMSETSGIGTRIETEESFIPQFTGLSAPLNWSKGGNVTLISGATKSSKAFTRGVAAALRAVEILQGGEQ